MKTVKSFCILLGKILLVTIPLVLLWIYTALAKMRYMDGEAPYYMWLREQIHTYHEDVDVIFMGDSTMNSAINPTLITGVGALNLASGGSCPYEGYYMLKEYLEHNPTPKVLYYGYEYEHMAGTGSLWDRTIYTHLIDYKDARDMFDTFQEMDYRWALDGQGNVQRKVLSYYLNYPGRYLPAIINAGFAGRYESNMENWNIIDANKGHYMAITDEVNPDYHEYTIYNYSVADVCDVYMRRTMDLCQEYGIQVRLIGMPTCPNTKYDEAFQKAEFGYMNGIAEAYENATYLPINTDMAHELFMDGHHLNNAGCKYFTNYLMETYPEDFD